jgi:hypothetical protein
MHFQVVLGLQDNLPSSLFVEKIASLFEIFSALVNGLW